MNTKFVIKSTAEFSKNHDITKVFFAFCSESSAKKQDNSKVNNKKISAETPDIKGLSASVVKDMNFSGFLGDLGQSRFFHESNILVVGLGAKKDLNFDTFKQAAATVWKALSQAKVEKFEVDMKSSISAKTEPSYVQAFVEGLYMKAYSWVKKLKQEKADKVQLNLVCGKTKPANDAIQVGEIFGESINFTRRLGDTPGNLMTPTHLAKEAQSLSKLSEKLNVTTWNKARILKENMGGLYGVSKGSDEEPRFVIMNYKGGSSKASTLCLVGKGLTFDAGGISIKPSAGMHEMKYDMCGGAAVLGAMKAIAQLKLKVNVMALVSCSENLLGGSANKPGDILTIRNGKTVEVLNTDAEGRLIMADALSYATEKKPAAIASAATLTGAMVVALGNTHTGFYSHSKALVKKVQQAGKNASEALWQMPLTKDHTKDMKGTHGDLSNLSSFRGAGSATAAAFLNEFVGDDIPYAHFDIAGTAWNAGNRKLYYGTGGATGVLVKTFVELSKLI